jgi:hypothetical protein
LTFTLGAKASIHLLKGDKSVEGPDGEGYLQLLRVVSIQRELEKTRAELKTNYGYTRINTYKNVPQSNGPTESWSSNTQAIKETTSGTSVRRNIGSFEFTSKFSQGLYTTMKRHCTPS